MDQRLCQLCARYTNLMDRPFDRTFVFFMRPIRPEASSESIHLSYIYMITSPDAILRFLPRVFSTLPNAHCHRSL